MKLTILALMLLVFVLLVSAIWTYKNHELQDNQILVYLTGADISGVEGVEPTPIFEPVITSPIGKPTEVQVNGLKIPCTLTREEVETHAVGPLKTGHLVNGAKISLDGPYTFVGDYHKRKGLNYATIEMINALEISGCAVLSKHGSRVQVMDLSWKDGGPRQRGASEGGHVRGLDADVAFMCKTNGKAYPCNSASRFDPASTWTLIKSIAKYSDAQFIFLDQPLIEKLEAYTKAVEPREFTNGIFKGEGRLLRHWPGHDDHFHIRIRCPSDDRQCINQRGGYRRTEPIEQIQEETENQVTEETSAPISNGLCKAGVMGDSITAWASFNYVDKLNSLCGANVFDNYGIGGQGTGAMAARFDTDIISHNYRDAIILAGVNDIASRRSVTTIKNNLANMYKKAKDAGMRVIAVTITPWQDHSSWTPEFQAKTEEINAWILSKPANVDVVVDAYAVLNAFSTKPLHPNPAGQKAIGDAIYNAAYSSAQCEELKCPLLTS